MKGVEMGISDSFKAERLMRPGLHQVLVLILDELG